MAAAVQETDQGPSADAPAPDDLDTSKGWSDFDSRYMQDDAHQLQPVDELSQQTGTRPAAVFAHDSILKLARRRPACSGLVLQPRPRIGLRPFIIGAQRHPMPSDAKSKIGL